MNMNNSSKNVFIFAAGAAIGSVVTWKLLKTKYEHIAQEEIDSVKKVFSRGKRSKINPIDDSAGDENEESVSYNSTDISEYARILRKSGYTDY